MSEKLYNKIIDNIDDEQYYLEHICFEGDRENFLYKLESLFNNKKLTQQEYNDVVNKTEDIPDCIWDDMVECNPD